MAKYTIYRYYVVVNGKELSYVGVVLRHQKQSLKSFLNNGSGYTVRTKMSSAITKYGEGSFKFEILNEAENKTDALQLKKQYISYFDSVNNGFNERPGVDTFGKAVQQLDKDGNLIAEYPSIKDAAKKMGTTNSNISHCCRGKHKTAVGYIWKYK